MRFISKKIGLSSDYASLILTKLLSQKLIKKIANNVFILTARGRSFLEHRRGGLERKIKPSALLAISRSFDSEAESLFFEPEIHFVKENFIAEQPRLIEHNLGKDQTIEVTDARSIQPSLKRLTLNRKKLKH